MKKTYYIEMWDARKQKWQRFGGDIKVSSDEKARREIEKCTEMMPGKTFQLVCRDDNRWLGYAVAPMPQARKDARQDAG